MSSSSRTGTTTEITRPSVPRVYRQRRGRPPDRRGRARPRAGARPAAPGGAGAARGCCRTGAGGGRARGGRPAALPELGDGRLRAAGGRHAGHAPGRRPHRGRAPGAARARRPGRQWGSPRAGSSPRAPTPSSRSSTCARRTARSAFHVRLPKETTCGRWEATSASGAPVLRAGTTVAPSGLAALASAGVAHPRCAARPRVAIVTTGTELRRPGEPLADGRDLRVERRHARRAARLGRSGRRCRARASRTTRRRTGRRSSAGSRRTCSSRSGGVSVGPHDLVRATLEELGAEEVFWGVAMRPGKPLSFAVRGDTLVFGLPGNPVSSLVGALLFVVPALRALQGASAPAPRSRRASSRRPRVDSPAGTTTSAPAAEQSDAGTLLRPIEGQESHMIVRAAAADALVHVPRGEGSFRPARPCATSRSARRSGRRRSRRRSSRPRPTP